MYVNFRLQETIRSGMLLPIVFGLLSGCFADDVTATSGRVEQRLTLTGSSTVAPLASEIAKRFELEHPGIRIDVQTGGSSRGISDATSGLADIGMASRALKDGETDSLLAHTIAFDGVGVIVHAENLVAALSNEQIRQIYRGEFNNWREVSGPDLAITVINKSAGRATLEVFMNHFGMKERQIQAQVIVGDNEQGIKTVAGNPGAIAYVSIGAAEYNIQQGTPIRLLASGGVAATLENVGLGKFPISRPLNLITQDAPQGLVLQFVDYCQSAAVNDLVRDLYFIPVGRDQIPDGY